MSSLVSHSSCLDARGAIHALRVSDDGQWLASSDTNNNIHVFNLDVMKVRSRLSFLVRRCFSPNPLHSIMLYCPDLLILSRLLPLVPWSLC